MGDLREGRSDSKPSGRRLAALALAAALVFSLAASPASAHRPRLGWYDCYYQMGFVSPTYVGSLRLLPEMKYRVLGSDRKGLYRIPRHHRIKLKTGSWAGWRGRYVKNSSGYWVLNIYEGDGDYIGTCAHR